MEKEFEIRYQLISLLDAIEDVLNYYIVDDFIDKTKIKQDIFCNIIEKTNIFTGTLEVKIFSVNDIYKYLVIPMMDILSLNSILSSNELFDEQYILKHFINSSYLVPVVYMHITDNSVVENAQE